MFGKKYDEFAADLLETYPELKAELAAAVAIPAEDRLVRYKAERLAGERFGDWVARIFWPEQPTETAAVAA